MNSPVTVNGTPFIKDIELNVPKNETRLKAKFKYINGEEEIPIGILITQYTLPSLNASNTGLSISVEGSEYKHEIPFNLQIGYNFIKREWFIKGHIKFKRVDLSFKTLSEFPIESLLIYLK